MSSHGTVYVIPTEDEWYKAAYYDGGSSVYHDYPTGLDTEPDGIDSSTDTEFDAVFYDEYRQDHPNDVDNAGVLSPYGTMGQGGNVWEWNETTSGPSRSVRGGYWGSYSISLAASLRNFSFPANEYYYIGFRVAQVPEPGTITLLLCGLASLALLRRQR